MVEKEYDAKRAREERENLMTHYEKLLKDKVSELSVEKRETAAIREAMSRVTPSKRNSGNEQEVASLREQNASLREELMKKSEVIR